MYEDVLSALNKFYDECCRECNMDYLYGYFDAVAIIRELADNKS